MPSKKKALAVAVGAVVVGGGLYWGASKIGAARRRAKKKNGLSDTLPVKKGHFITQSDVGLPTMTWASTKPTDFVLLGIESHDKKFREWAWAEVVAAKPDKEKVYVQLRGQLGESSAQPLATNKHGFRIGTRAFVDRNSILDRLRLHPADLDEKGKLYCGVFAEELTGDEPAASGQLIVKRGDQVRIAISTKTAPEEHLDEPWVVVDGVSRTGNVIGGTIIEPLDYTPQHGFKQWDEIEFTHDCILDAK